MTPEDANEPAVDERVSRWRTALKKNLAAARSEWQQRHHKSAKAFFREHGFTETTYRTFETDGEGTLGTLYRLAAVQGMELPELFVDGEMQGGPINVARAERREIEDEIDRRLSLPPQSRDIEDDELIALLATCAADPEMWTTLRQVIAVVTARLKRDTPRTS